MDQAECKSENTLLNFPIPCLLLAMTRDSIAISETNMGQVLKGAQSPIAFDMHVYVGGIFGNAFFSSLDWMYRANQNE